MIKIGHLESLGAGILGLVENIMVMIERRQQGASMQVKPFEGVEAISKEEYLRNKLFLDNVFSTSYERRCFWDMFKRLNNEISQKIEAYSLNVASEKTLQRDAVL